MVKKTVLLYDYLFSRGGAEKLSYTLAKGINGCDFKVGLCDTTLFPDEDLNNDGGKLQVLTGYTALKGWKTLKVMLVFIFTPPDLREYDCAIYSGEYAPMALLRKKSRAKRNILYCHTIPRAPYDLYEFKLQSFTGVKRLLFKILAFAIKTLYGPSVKKMDLIIANSENVRGRIKNHLGLESVVVNPPIDTERFQWISQGDYYLSTARLEPAKRIETIIQAFKAMPDKKLVVASGGSDYEKLLKLAAGHDNIRLTNWTTDEELFDLVGNCIATVYIPVDEDFGMSPLESMSAGKPCIGVAEGGLLETIIHDKTGWLIPELTISSLQTQISMANAERCLAMKDVCISHAQGFSAELFLKRINKYLDANA